MKSIIQSTLTLAIAIALIGVGATGAFFADTETSSGNTFAAGVIDLMVGNESYYNGNACTNVSTDPQVEDWRWVGDAEYPVPGTPCTVSWADTTRSLLGKLFFAFADLKPDDEGEDTISLTVETNDAWACMEVSLTSNDDISSNEPELLAGDIADVVPDTWDGELAQHLQFLWWADDGDNVLESDEYPARVLSDDVQTLYDLATSSGSFQVALADSVTNVWTGSAGPLLAGTTYHIGKAWCFGTLTPAPVLAGQGVSPAVDPGIACDGTMIPDVNRIQTDGATLDVSFIAHQARHDSAYVCPNEELILPCENGEQYADRVVSTDQGVQRGGATVLPARSIGASMLGAPEGTTTAGTFYALGFATTTRAASVVLVFDDNVVVDKPGPDLKVYEITGGSYPEELVKVDVSIDGSTWINVGTALLRTASIDLGAYGVSVARYVRLTDVTPRTNFPVPPSSNNSADGYDVDAIEALSCVVSPAR
jgi:predicted ribosomally synthesized peptide with SipW-like signal peptide